MSLVDLKEKGFVIIRGEIDQSNVIFAQNNIKGNTVHYGNLEQYINNNMVKTVKNKFGMDLEVVKYRISNNTNSTDAGDFHRDMMTYNLDLVPAPVYTLLCYLDKSEMDVIPGSHKKITMNYWEMLTDKSIRITMNPGDLLLFHNTLLHRGVFTNKTKNRRLIQLFDCVEKKNKNILNKMVHLACYKDCNTKAGSMKSFIVRNKFFHRLAGFVYTYTTKTGYGAVNPGFKDKLGLSRYDYFSGEANQDRLEPRRDRFEKDNLYVVLSDIDTLKDVKTNQKISEYVFYRPMIKLLIQLIIMIVLLWFIVRKYVI